ncbi:MAG: glycosyl hydrolase, partial [Maribacter sp.]|nr:glycosyl hydrolase [Maribacter sp.]
DGGDTWNEINKGLPKTELGRIGLAISPANPEIIYAIVEAADGKGGFYASTDRGNTWDKRGDHKTSGNYYQEIIADPIDENIIYSMDTWMSVSHDGGKTFKKVGEDYKHVDNHSMWIDPNDNQHWLVGCDGGIYETFDSAKTWDFKENLPVTQFYKVALDNAEPFYNVYGGTQDNFSLGGPSRVLTNHGITNSDWFITNGGDGFESQVDPNNPDIVYAQSQYGYLVRYDKKSGEKVGIQPREPKGGEAYRFNWDAPLAVSKHAAGRLYFAANKLFRSDDYGNSWKTISDDLTRQLDRNKLKVYDRIVSIDAVAKNGSTSLYGSIVALSESPLNSHLLAVGTDDGLVHITEDDGATWRKISSINGAPDRSYVNSVYLSRHDANVIYVAFNHHKYGDFKPYIFRSSDKGKTWKSITSNLPNRGSVYALEEDHLNPDLIFCGTEFGVYFSTDRGQRWKELATGLPTIAVRDIAIQERENDLVLGTFGRGFYVLDDYSALRTVKNEFPSEKAIIYPIRDALSWEQSSPLGLPGKAFQGDNFYSAPNLGPVAMITYYYNEDYKSLKEKRTKKEEALIEEGKDTAYPDYTALKAERDEQETKLLFTIRNANGKVVKKEFKKPSKGIQRFQWDLRFTPQDPIDMGSSTFYNPFSGKDEGTLVAPGKYTVDLQLFKDGTLSSLVEPVEFNVVALKNTTMPAEDRMAKVAFQRQVAQLQADLSVCQDIIGETKKKLKYMKVAIERSEQPYGTFYTSLIDIENKLKDISIALYGDPVKYDLDMGQPQTPANRIRIMGYEQKYSTSTPTKTHQDNYEIAREEIDGIKKKVETIFNTDIKQLEEQLIKSGAAYTPGRGYNNKD